MKALEAADQSVGMGEEAANHFGYTYTRLDMLTSWAHGFAAGLADDCDYFVSLQCRAWRLLLRCFAFMRKVKHV